GLSTEVESLKRERSKAISQDPNSDDMIRSLLYGMSGSIGLMIESINERSDKENRLDETVSSDTTLLTNTDTPVREEHPDTPAKRRYSSILENTNTAAAKIFECSKCEKKFDTEQGLKHHVNVHRGEN
ncbi:hypothetical protein PENTCL1PPCAC_17012, partial [Pristionchus entomophagus]